MTGVDKLQEGTQVNVQFADAQAGTARRQGTASGKAGGKQK